MGNVDIKNFSVYRSEMQRKIQAAMGRNDLIGVKAAILTWCNTNGPANYGQLLQCYAVQEILQTFGCETRVIRYEKSRSEHIENKEVCNLKKRDEKRHEVFEAFIKQYMVTTPVINTTAEVINAAKDADILVCGSDQIWNPIWENDVFLLGFGRSEQKKIAFAPSGIFWSDSSTIDFLERRKSFFRTFDVLTCREWSGAKLLSQYTNCEVSVCPDPTLLLSKDTWEKFANRCVENSESYILCYFLGSILPYADKIDELKKKNGVDEIYILPSHMMDEELLDLEGIRKFDSADPAEFLSLIQNAQSICTDSFHGVVFGHIFEKKVYFATRQEATEDRIGRHTRVENLWLLYGIDTHSLDEVEEENKLVSVIMPTYNRLNTLPCAIKSVLSQTYHNLELLIVDDGSQDETAQLVENYSDSRIRYIRLQENKGASYARNIGIESAHGEIIAFLDSDNEWAISHLSRRIPWLTSSENIEFSFGAMCRYDMGSPSNIFPGNSVEEMENREELLRLMIEGNRIDTNTVVMRKSCVNRGQRFDESMTALEDWDFFTEIIKSNEGKIYFEPFVTVKHFDTHDGIDKKRKERLLNHTRFFCHHAELTVCSQQSNVKLNFDSRMEEIGNLSCEDWNEDVLTASSPQKDDILELSGVLLRNEYQIYKNLSSELNALIERKRNAINNWRACRAILNADNYLNKRGIKSVAVYGYGCYGRLLVHQLQILSVRITCIVDRSVKARTENGIAYLQEPMESCGAELLIVTILSEGKILACQMDEIFGCSAVWLPDMDGESVY